MNEQTIQALNALAAKLSTTAEYLWGVLVKQAPIEGALDLAVMAAWAIALICLARYVYKNTAGEDPHWTDDVVRTFAWAGVGLAVLLVTIICGSNFTSAVSAIINPEYWALKQLLAAI